MAPNALNGLIGKNVQIIQLLRKEELGFTIGQGGAQQLLEQLTIMK